MAYLLLYIPNDHYYDYFFLAMWDELDQNLVSKVQLKNSSIFIID